MQEMTLRVDKLPSKFLNSHKVITQMTPELPCIQAAHLVIRLDICEQIATLISLPKSSELQSHTALISAGFHSRQ